MPDVKDLMSTPVFTLSPQKTAFDAALLMEKKDIETIVVTWGDVVVGIVTEKDLVRKVIAQNKPYTVKLSDVMSEPVISIEPGASLRKAKMLMGKHKVKRLPVVEDGILIGIVTASDLNKN
jgi:CBS domain-containing protein